MNEQERNAAIEDYQNNFPKYLKKVFTFADDSTDSVGMLGASFYVLRLGNAKIAIDPYIKLAILPELSLETIRNAFAQLDGILLTHEHRDNYDRKLIAILHDLALKWYVPSFFRCELLNETLLEPDKIAFIEADSSFDIKDVTITPFNSSHNDPKRNTETPEFGYYLESGGKTLLFPIDVRVYNPALLPRFNSVDNLYLHIWLGACETLELPCEPKLTEMCDFAATYKPGKIFLGIFMNLTDYRIICGRLPMPSLRKIR